MARGCDSLGLTSDRGKDAGAVAFGEPERPLDLIRSADADPVGVLRRLRRAADALRRDDPQAGSRMTPSASSSLIVPYSRMTLGPPLTSDQEPSPSKSPESSAHLTEAGRSQMRSGSRCS